MPWLQALPHAWMGRRHRKKKVDDLEIKVQEIKKWFQAKRCQKLKTKYLDIYTKVQVTGTGYQSQQALATYLFWVTCLVSASCPEQELVLECETWVKYWGKWVSKTPVWEKGNMEQRRAWQGDISLYSSWLRIRVRQHESWRSPQTQEILVKIEHGVLRVQAVC